MSKEIFGAGMDFVPAEAYKLLRTNILFSLADEGESHVIGITSAFRSEGKSTTSINLAYEIAESGKKVILIDCDLRLPSISRKLNVPRSPGLSNVLAAMDGSNAVIRPSGLHNDVHVITSGDIPPNPSELLAGPRMKTVIEYLKGVYDYIILDLPPVTIVSDALAVSSLTDGMIVVVREGFSNKRAVKDTIEQLKFVDARILGFVTTYATPQGKDYKYKGYGDKYGYDRNRYGRTPSIAFQEGKSDD